MPSSSITSNLRSMRSKARARCSGGMPSRSRNGWNSVHCMPRSRTILPTSRGDPGKPSRSFSKISTPSKPASATARSLSSRVPLIETVAIEDFMDLCYELVRTLTQPCREPPMSVIRFAHYNLRARDHFSSNCAACYVQVVGLHVGQRPAFEKSGYWLYADGKPVLHLVESGETGVADPHSSFSHAAFDCSDLEQTEMLLTRQGIAFRRSQRARDGRSPSYSSPIRRAMTSN